MSRLAELAKSVGIWAEKYDGLWCVGTNNKEFYDKLCICTEEELFHLTEELALEHAAKVLGLSE